MKTILAIACLVLASCSHKNGRFTEEANRTADARAEVLDMLNRY